MDPDPRIGSFNKVVSNLLQVVISVHAKDNYFVFIFFPEAAVVWEETQPTFDQEMDSYQFSSPEVVLAATSMNKCDAAVQEIVQNNKKIPKDPVKIKTYSRAQIKIATKAKGTGADRTDNGEEKQDGNADVEQVKHDGEKFLTCQNGMLSSRKEDMKGNASEEATTFSSNPQAAKRVQAKEKCFGKRLKERRLKKTISPPDFENKGQNDTQLAEKADILQFGSRDESKITDKDKENVEENSFTRLRSRSSGTCMPGTLMAMFNKGPSHEGTPKAVKSAPKTRAQKRMFPGTPLNSSGETIPQNEPDVLREKKMTTNSKETPVKPQGLN